MIEKSSTNFTSWIVSTYIQVKRTGIACEIITHFPEEGIVIADRDSLGDRYPYLRKVMLICAKGDREFHPSAHLHVVLNPIDISPRENRIWNPYYIPHWTQPGLVPRNSERGSSIENIAFLGTRKNLANDFLSERWIQALHDLGCNWKPLFAPERWSNYRDIDVVIAVRTFDGNIYPHKPASKLVSCWRASVPAVLAPESAYLFLKQSELDFLTVHSLEETIQAIEKLKNDPSLYLSMIENGRERAREFSEDKITESWVKFFQNNVFLEYERWIALPEIARLSRFFQRYYRLKKARLAAKIETRFSRMTGSRSG